jgi:hypothetical protein
MRYVLSAAVALMLAGCGVITQDNTARMPNASTGGPVLNENEAIALSGTLKDPTALHGDPARAARAVAAEDWLAGQTILYGNYGDYQPGGSYYWQQFRDQVRGALGIAPTVPSQVVVNHMLAASDALKSGDSSAAEAQFQAPDFSLGGQGTVTALANLPLFPAYGAAFAELRRNNEREQGGHCGGAFGGC